MLLFSFIQFHVQTQSLHKYIFFLSQNMFLISFSFFLFPNSVNLFSILSYLRISITVSNFRLDFPVAVFHLKLSLPIKFYSILWVQLYFFSNYKHVKTSACSPPREISFWREKQA